MDQCELVRGRLCEALAVDKDTSLDDVVSIAVHRLRGLGIELYEIEHNLGIALGYPLGEEGGPFSGEPVIGDATAAALAMEIARRIGYSRWTFFHIDG